MIILRSLPATIIRRHMNYDHNVLEAVSSINVILATRSHNLWPQEIAKLESALSILDKLRIKQ